MIDLKDDELKIKDGYHSVVICRLRVQDKTMTFNNQEPPYFEGMPARPSSVKRSSEDGSDWYDALYVAQVMPGVYHIDKIHFPMGSTSFGSTITGYTTKTYFFEIDIDKVWTVEPGKLIYLGEFNVVFNEIKSEKRKTVFNYSLRIDRGTESLNSALQVFGGKFPRLTEQFRAQAETAPWSLFSEHFSLKLTKSPKKHVWPDRRDDAEFDAYVDRWSGDNYIIEPKKDSCYWQVVTPSAQLPGNFDVQLKSVWKSGREDSAYGLVFGPDVRNNYQFEVSGNGFARIAKYVDSNYQQPPPLAWKPNTARKGDGAVHNIHTIKVRGDQMSYYVNGSLIGTVPNTYDLKNWIIGISVCNKQKVSFDDLAVTERYVGGSEGK